MHRIRSPRFLLVLAAAALVTLLVPELGRSDIGTNQHLTGWISEGESGVFSSDGAEETYLHPTKTNLCEDIAGIPGEISPGWVRVNGSSDPNTPFVQASGQVLPDLYHALHTAGPPFKEGEHYKTRSEERRVGKECRSRWS